LLASLLALPSGVCGQLATVVGVPPEISSPIRERLDFSDVPAPLKGIAITFIVASLMSMAFLGFSHLFGL